MSMGFLVARLRADWRRSWRSTVFLIVLVGAAGAVAMTAATGARRADSALGRFVSYGGPRLYEMEVDPEVAEQVGSLPYVIGTGRGAFMFAAPVTDHGAGGIEVGEPGEVYPIANFDQHGAGRSRFFVVAGEQKAAAEMAVDEIYVDESLAERFGLAVGSRFGLKGMAPEQMEEESDQPTEARGPLVWFRVLGIVRLPHDLDPAVFDSGIDAVQARSEWAFLGDAFWQRYGQTFASFGTGFGVVIDDVANEERLVADVDRLSAGEGFVATEFDDQMEAARRTQRAIDVEVVALWAFAAAAGLGGAVIAGQAVARQVRSSVGEHAQLRAIGVRPAQLRAEGVVRGLLVGGVGALVAVVMAALASPLTPIGLARRAEVQRGVWIDGFVLAIGAAVIAAVMTVASLVGSGHVALPGARRGRVRTPRLTGRFASFGSVPAQTGLRMALAPSAGSSAVPVRSAVIGAAVAVAAVTASVTFSTSLGGLLADRAAQGWSFDATAGDDEDGFPEDAADSVRAMSTVEAASAVAPGTATAEGLTTPIRLVGLEAVKGEIAPTIVKGRMARGPDEVVLGTSTMHALGAEIGDTVRLFDDDKDVGPGDRQEADFVVVGQAVLPAAMSEATLRYAWSLGDGGVVTVDGLRRVNPDVEISSFALRFVPDADPVAAEREVEAALGNTMIGYFPPFEIDNLHRVRSLPFTLAGVLGTLAAGTLAHALVMGVVHRRRELAVYRALGFHRREVRSTVAWHATILVMAALVIGLPFGVAGGRWGWINALNRLGGVWAPQVPVMVLLAAALAVVAFANLVSVVPGWRAARVRPAEALRAE